MGKERRWEGPPSYLPPSPCSWKGRKGRRNYHFLCRHEILTHKPSHPIPCYEMQKSQFQTIRPSWRGRRGGRTVTKVYCVVQQQHWGKKKENVLPGPFVFERRSSPAKKKAFDREEGGGSFCIFSLFSFSYQSRGEREQSWHCKRQRERERERETEREKEREREREPTAARNGEKAFSIRPSSSWFCWFGESLSNQEREREREKDCCCCAAAVVVAAAAAAAAESPGKEEKAPLSPPLCVV